jgi:MFS family permease
LLSDHVGREKTFTLGAWCLAAAALCLFILNDARFPLPAYLFVLLFGAGWGATAPTFMSVSADLFQGKNFGLIYGVTEAVIGLGSAIGPWLAGYIFDWQESYRLAFLVAAGLSALSSGIVWLAPPEKCAARDGRRVADRYSAPGFLDTIWTSPSRPPPPANGTTQSSCL